jgi:release factor glutamine methyltransferase
MNMLEPRLTYLSENLKTLPDKPEETPESTLRALWTMAAGSPMSAERALTAALPELDPEQNKLLDALIQRRLEGVPLGHITGRQMFMGLELTVSADALLPRRETEILARGAEAIVAELVENQGSALAVDTCCGSGNVALALAHKEPALRVVGVDLSDAAVELAKLNARSLGLDDRVEFRAGDLLTPVLDLTGQVDLITCNPPYISTANVLAMTDEIATHEPSMAFDGGPFGIRILNRLIKEAPSLLRPYGQVAFEVGLGQGEPMLARIQKMDVYASIEPFRDASGAIRAIAAELA